MSIIVSVIVPVYNGEKYLKRCIESILKQTFQDFELLLIDDGSTDNSKKILEYYQDLDDRIHLYSKKIVVYLQQEIWDCSRQKEYLSPLLMQTIM